MKRILIFLISIIVSSCSSVIKVQESFRSDDYDFTLLNNSEIIFAGTEKIYLKEFVKTFIDEYANTNKLNNKLYDLFLTEFKNQIPDVTLSKLETKVPKVLKGDLSFKNYDLVEADSFFSSLESDFLIFINNIEISNICDNSPYFNAATSTTTGTSSEDCIVSIEVECWDVANQKRILRFKGVGRDTVILFSFLSSLNDALQDAVVHSVEYMRNKAI